MLAPRSTKSAYGHKSPTRDIEAFLDLIASLLGRLAGASGDAVTREVDAGLYRLLTFFDVEQCGILEVQPDRRMARLRHLACVEGIPPLPTTIDYGSYFPWSHSRAVVGGEMGIVTCVDDFPPEASVDRESSVKLGMQAIITVPVGFRDQVTHVLGLVSSRPMRTWPDAVMRQLKITAETFLAAIARHAAEQALQESERALAEAQHIAEVGSYVRDWTTGELRPSEEANRICGIDLCGASDGILSCVHPDDRERAGTALDPVHARHEPSNEIEFLIVRPDGTTRAVRSRTETTFAADGSPVRTLGTIRDVSEMRAVERESRRLRAELRHVDRVAHLGALTASLSHELNQPLTGILSNAQAGLRMMTREELDRGEMREILGSIVRDDRRAAAVIGNLRSMLRREEPGRVLFDPADAIREVLAIFRSELEAHSVELTFRVEASSLVLADKTQIQQVLLNLLANAVHSMGGRARTQRRLTIGLAPIDRASVEVSVQDTGAGISNDCMSRLFEPFFTTRSDGLGMGLAISRSIVEAHGGAINAISNAGGATFRFTLPAQVSDTSAPCSGAADPKPNETLSGRHTGATVAVVDDDPGIRDAVARLLDAAGLSVAKFESADAALESPTLADAQCLVVDVQMPGFSGLELQEELARRQIEIPIVFLTARGDAELGVEAMKRGAFEYLLKPTDDTALIDSVRRAIAHHVEQSRSAREREEVKSRLARLTARERDVLECVIAGLLNKQIASDLAISEATVKQHRGQVMDKMGVRSVADLVRLCQLISFPGGS